MKLANAVSTGSPPTVSQGSHVRSEHSHGCDQQPVELDPNSKTRKILVTMNILALNIITSNILTINTITINIITINVITIA